MYKCLIQTQESKVNEDRFNVNYSSLPCPASFRNAAVALRKNIKILKAQNMPIKNELIILYNLAVWQSFNFGDYVPEYQCTGHSVLETINFDSIKTLPFAYSQVGINKLPLLNTSDKKIFISEWGAASSHLTLVDLYQPIHQACFINASFLLLYGSSYFPNNNQEFIPVGDIELLVNEYGHLKQTIKH